MGNVTPGELHESDYTEVLALNEAAVPAVNSIPRSTLGHLHEQAVCTPVLREGGQVCAFAILLDESASYHSANFLWFKNNYPRFVYVDRIVVDPRYAGRGLGRSLYGAGGPVAATRGVILGCEVNLEPPNPGSVAFHRNLGFRAVGEQLTGGGAKRVSFMVHDAPQRLARG